MITIEPRTWAEKVVCPRCHKTLYYHDIDDTHYDYYSGKFMCITCPFCKEEVRTGPGNTIHYDKDSWMDHIFE